MVVEECRPAPEERVRLTDVNPHLVCVLCHGYFVDATTITECLHSFCRSCIFRHLETKPFCPICEVQVHTRLHRSLKADKTLQDIVYKLVPGLFHNEMERRRQFYKLHPHRDEHMEPERRGVGLDRLIYSPSDTISLSLEFYDIEREKEEWSAITCTKPQKDSSSTPKMSPPSASKRYLQCPAEFKMAHLKKFIRQKYNLSPNAEVEIIYKRESLPDTYSLMDVAYIYTWKRNGPMRFYYRLPGVVDMDQFEKMQALEQAKERELAQQAVTSEETRDEEKLTEKKKETPEPTKTTTKVEHPILNGTDTTQKEHVSQKLHTPREKSSSERNRPEAPKESPPIQEKIEKIILSLKKSPAKDGNDVPIYEAKVKVSTVTSSTTVSKPAASTAVEPPAKKHKESSPETHVKEEVLKEQKSVKMSKQDELPVSVLLSLGQCRVGKTEETKAPSPQPPQTVPPPVKSVEAKSKPVSNSRISVNKIANELHQRAAINGMQKSKENNTTHAQSPKRKVQSQPDKQQVFNFPEPIQNKPASPNKVKKPQINNINSNNKTATSDMGVMDQRIQQLYRTQGLIATHNNSNNTSNVKSESRLANWLNNRFQTKPSSPNNSSTPPSQSSLAQNIASRFSNTAVSSPKTFKNIAPKLTPSNNSPKVPTSASLSSHKSPVGNGMPPPSKRAPKVSSPGNHYHKSKSPSTHKLPPVPQMTPSSPVTVSLAASVASMPLVSPNGATVALAENIAMPGNMTPRPTVNYFVPNFNNLLPSMSLMRSPIHVPSYDVKTNHGIVYAPMVGITRNFEGNKVKNGYVKTPEEKSSTESVPEPVPSTPKEPNEPPTPEKEAPVEDPKQSPLTNGASSPVTNGSSSVNEPLVSSPQVNGKPMNVGEEVNQLKRKLEELKRRNDNNKGREVAGCQITKENPDIEAAKRQRDTTPVVSIELMRGKRPVPALKAIQDVVELGKRKSGDEKKSGEKKLKLSTKKEGKGEDANALDLSRCGAPPQNPAISHWFNPMVNQYLSSNK